MDDLDDLGDKNLNQIVTSSNHKCVKLKLNPYIFLTSFVILIRISQLNPICLNFAKKFRAVSTRRQLFELITKDDKIDIGPMQEKLKKRDDLPSVMTSINNLENMRYKFDKVVDKLLMDFVHTKQESLQETQRSKGKSDVQIKIVLGVFAGKQSKCLPAKRYDITTLYRI